MPNPVAPCRLPGTLMSQAKPLPALLLAGCDKDLLSEPSPWFKKYAFCCYFFVLFLLYIYLVCVCMYVTDAPCCTYRGQRKIWGRAVISLLLCGLQLENSDVIRIGGKRLYRLSHHAGPSATSSCSSCGP